MSNPVCYIYKTCTQCSTSKHRDLFYLKRKDSHEIHSLCKECSNVRDREQRKKRKELEQVVSEGTRTCAKCSCEKPLEDFAKDLTKPLGRRYNCKTCCNSYTRGRRDDPEFREYRRRKLLEWHRKNPHKNSEYHQKRKARKLSVEFENYTVEDLLKRDGDACYLCGKQEKLTTEHLIPVSKGGPTVLSNLALACRSCNSKKGSKLPDELPEAQRARVLSRLSELSVV